MDNPVFDGMYDYFKYLLGSAYLSSQLILDNKHDKVIYWMGGFHHA